MNAFIPKSSKKSLRNITFVCIQLTKSLVNQCIHNILIAIVDVGFRKIKVYYFTFFVA